MQNIVVTGGAGFIGSNFVKKIVNLKYNLINIDCLTYASNYNYLKYLKNKNNYFFYKTNILDEKKVIYILKNLILYIFLILLLKLMLIIQLKIQKRLLKLTY